VILNRLSRSLRSRDNARMPSAGRVPLCGTQPPDLAIDPCGKLRFPPGSSLIRALSRIETIPMVNTLFAKVDQKKIKEETCS